jgi:hypothetical protein
MPISSTDLDVSVGAVTGRKGTRWMPRREKAMKDVASCDKLR